MFLSFSEVAVIALRLLARHVIEKQSRYSESGHIENWKKNATVPWAQERVSELAIEWAQRSAWAKRTVRNMQTSERMSEWPTTFVLISWVSESQAIRCACHAFFDAPSHLYKRVCLSVHPSGRRSVAPSLRRLLGTSYAEYSALLR